MKKGKWILISALIIVLLFATFSAVSAQPNRPIVCSVDMEFNGAAWVGTVDDCILKGDITFKQDPDNPSYFTGKVIHFFELFTIEPDLGDEIHGTTAGTGHFFKPPYQFRTNGWVTGATGRWVHMVGYKYFEMGNSTNPLLFPNEPLKVEDMVLRIVPAHHR